MGLVALWRTTGGSLPAATRAPSTERNSPAPLGESSQHAGGVGAKGDRGLSPKFELSEARGDLRVFVTVDAGEPQPDPSLLTRLSADEQELLRVWATDEPAVLVAKAEEAFRTSSLAERAEAHDRYRRTLNLVAKLMLPPPETTAETRARQAQFLGAVSSLDGGEVERAKLKAQIMGD